MFAAGGAGGSASSDYVWVGLADKDDWERVRFLPGDLVADVADKACWALGLGRARLYAVTKGAGEPRPKQAAIAAALGQGHLAPEAAWASVGVASGGWLVAVPKVPAGGAGGSVCGCFLRTPPPTAHARPPPPQDPNRSLYFTSQHMTIAQPLMPMQ